MQGGRGGSRSFPMEWELGTSNFCFLAMGATDGQLIVIVRMAFVEVNLSNNY